MLIIAQLLNNSDNMPSLLRPNSDICPTGEIFVPLRMLKKVFACSSCSDKCLGEYAAGSSMKYKAILSKTRRWPDAASHKQLLIIFVMGKVTSLQGKATGKIGSMVYSISGGQMIAREYQPNVANPSTVKQVNQRARLKLASQIAAALAPVIAIPRDGLQSSRNLFMKNNMDYFLANNGVAQVSYENLQLTNGNAGLPAITAERSTEDGLVIHLMERADASVSRVVYIIYKKTSENQLQYLGSIVQPVAGDDGKFQASTGYVTGEIVIWAYGMKDTTAKARAKYGDYEVANAEDLASLVMSRAINAGEYQFTQTRGTTIFDGEGGSIQAGEDEFMVYITASGPGSVAGNGFVGNRKAVQRGSSVTVSATPNEGCQFLGWKNNGSSTYLTTSAEYTFVVNQLADLVAVFNNPNSGTGGQTGDGGYE